MKFNRLIDGATFPLHAQVLFFIMDVGMIKKVYFAK